jgi:glucose/arabinose dehydrogenase
VTRTALVALVLAAQIYSPQACRSPSQTQPQPQPTPGPGDTLPITDEFTTQDGVRLGVQTVVTQLEVPWSLAFAPDGRLFFTERPGRVRVYQNGALVPAPALTLDDVQPTGEAGLLGIALHPNFAQNHFVYLLYTAATSRGAVNRLARYRELNNTLAERAVLREGMAAASIHDGGRIRFGPDGMLYLTMGDAADTSNPQSLSSMNGKVLRLNDDGSMPGDNPFSSPVWTWGHRNPQGLDWSPTTGDLWATEHGNIGNDEVNLLRKGHNYGWPVIEGAGTRSDMDSPVRFYTPSIAPSGASFYTGTRMLALRGNFFFAALTGRHIQRVVLDPADLTRILTTERWLESRFGRIRDVITGPDGALYFCTSNRDGRGNPVATDDRIARIVPVQ